MYHSRLLHWQGLLYNAVCKKLVYGMIRPQVPLVPLLEDLCEVHKSYIILNQLLAMGTAYYGAVILTIQHAESCKRFKIKF